MLMYHLFHAKQSIKKIRRWRYISFKKLILGDVEIYSMIRVTFITKSKRDKIICPENLMQRQSSPSSKTFPYDFFYSWSDLQVFRQIEFSSILASQLQVLRLQLVPKKTKIFYCSWK